MNAKGAITITGAVAAPPALSGLTLTGGSITLGIP